MRYSIIKAVIGYIIDLDVKKASISYNQTSQAYISGTGKCFISFFIETIWRSVDQFQFVCNFSQSSDIYKVVFREN